MNFFWSLHLTGWGCRCVPPCMVCTVWTEDWIPSEPPTSWAATQALVLFGDEVSLWAQGSLGLPILPSVCQLSQLQFRCKRAKCCPSSWSLPWLSLWFYSGFLLSQWDPPILETVNRLYSVYPGTALATHPGYMTIDGSSLAQPVDAQN